MAADQGPEEEAEAFHAPGPLFKPLSDAELAKRRRLMDRPAAVLDQTTFAFLMIMISEGLM